MNGLDEIDAYNLEDLNAPGPGYEATGPELQQKLRYRFSREKENAEAIEDVYDGELYKRHFQNGGFLSSPDNLSFLGNTDGVSVVRSSGASVWPIYLVINELPPWERACTSPHSSRNEKNNALMSISNQESGMSKYSVKGLLGLSWAFSLPLFDIVKGTAVDYMHCICEGVIEQHFNKWFGVGDNSIFPCHIGKQLQEIDVEILQVKPTSEITRKPRKMSDWHDWKASEKRAFLLYYSVPLLMGRLPEEYLNHYNLLVGAIFRLLKSSITPVNLQQASLYLKLYCAQASGLYGERFQTYNFHQLLHLADNVQQLGPLWAHSCFPFEDYNGDLKDLFHGSQNIPGQIIQSVSILQKIPEVAARAVESEQVKRLFDDLTNRSHCCKRTEAISNNIYVVGALEKGKKCCNPMPNSDLFQVIKAHGPIG
ncbi:hypothetical protein QZH41_008812 [Actinostola sp. cb2023]|nr:hypothetical protein QZH41_008812 [Actinostola sp. cb2023]